MSDKRPYSPLEILTRANLARPAIGPSLNQTRALETWVALERAGYVVVERATVEAFFNERKDPSSGL